VATFVVLYVIKGVLGGWRVAEEDESQGLDLSEHSETAYMH
jgi:ammonia channel protein AmtB